MQKAQTLGASVLIFFSKAYTWFFVFLRLNEIESYSFCSDFSKSRVPEIRRHNPLFFLTQIVSTGSAWF